MNRRIVNAVLVMTLSWGVAGSSVHEAQDVIADAQRDYNAGRYNRAVDAVTSAIAKSPDDAPLHFLLGQSYYQLREFTRSAVPKRSVSRKFRSRSQGPATCWSV